MNDAAPGREPAMSAPLKLRIRAAERQLAERRADVRSHSAALGRSARASLGSPAALLAGVGAGFALGLFTRRRRASSPRPPIELPTARPSIFASLLDAVTLVSTVMALFPALGLGRGRDAGAATGGDEY